MTQRTWSTPCGQGTGDASDTTSTYPRGTREAGQPGRHQPCQRTVMPVRSSSHAAASASLQRTDSVIPSALADLRFGVPDLQVADRRFLLTSAVLRLAVELSLTAEQEGRATASRVPYSVRMNVRSCPKKEHRMARLDPTRSVSHRGHEPSERRAWPSARTVTGCDRTWWVRASSSVVDTIAAGRRHVDTPWPPSGCCAGADDPDGIPSGPAFGFRIWAYSRQARTSPGPDTRAAADPALKQASWAGSP